MTEQLPPNYELQKAVDKSGMKKQFIARNALVHPARFSRILHGQTRPNESEKRRIAGRLGQPVDKLFK